MVIKGRRKPVELAVLESLAGRMGLAPKLERQLDALRSGYSGEVALDQSLVALQDSVVQLSDVTFVGNQVCQLDTVLVSANGIYLLDVKNWQGAYTVGEHGFASLANDPLDQLKRAEKLFRRLLEQERIALPVESRLVFVNPELTLYGVQPEMPLVLPQQLPAYVERIGERAGLLTEREERVARRILRYHSDDNPYRQKVDYSWEAVGNGMLCAACRKLLVEKSHKYLLCPSCGVVEAKGAALRRTKRELDVLFPGCVPEVDRLYRFCGGMVSKRTIFDVVRK